MLKRKIRLFYLLTVISAVYLIWRLFFTLPAGEGWMAITAGILLLLSEAAGFLEILHITHLVSEIYLPTKADLPAERFPDVDVFIATYNEPVPILEKTVQGCLQMDYPEKGKVHIYLCDDGGRVQVRELAGRMGIRYLARGSREHAKAGNLNYALSNSSSPLIVTFDADMIPMHDFLTALVPYFFAEAGSDMERSEIGFIQSPQSFYNHDLFQYNLYLEESAPNEQNFFFRYVQLARNRNNAAIYGGSNTVLSRKALMDAGGFYTGSITEDLATGLLIQAAGYKGYAVSEVHASGLSPEDLTSLFKQRERWARGCIQTFRRLRLLRRKDLTAGQKRDYGMALLYWYTPLRRLMFILSPILYFVFGIPVIRCGLLPLICLWLPSVLLYYFALSKLAGDMRTARLSNIYDTILFPALLPGVILETLGIQKKQFSVTAKGKMPAGAGTGEVKRRDKGLIRWSRAVYLVLLGFTLAGVYRLFAVPALQENYGWVVVLFWLVLNAYHMLMALFFLSGRQVRRVSERIRAAEQIALEMEDQIIHAVTSDLSEGGASFLLNTCITLPDIFNVRLGIGGRYECRMKAKPVYRNREGAGWRYGIAFVEISRPQRLRLYGLLYDRVPPLPEQVTEGTGFYKDLRRNLKKRIRRR